MGEYHDAGELTSAILDDLQRFADKTLELMNTEVSSAMEDAYSKFGRYQQQAIQKIFDDAVTKFYNAYTPHTEGYEREGNTATKSGGLYDVLDMQTGDYGMVITGDPPYDELYDGWGMHEDRQGGHSLFDLVFKEGWHGGARSISVKKEEIWGSHPEPGKAYYRKGGWVKYPGSSGKKWHKYGKWGRRAFKSKSAYAMVSEDLQRSEAGEIYDEFKRISDRHNDEAMKRVYAKLPELKAQIMG